MSEASRQARPRRLRPVLGVVGVVGSLFVLAACAVARTSVVVASPTTSSAPPSTTVVGARTATPAPSSSSVVTTTSTSVPSSTTVVSTTTSATTPATAAPVPPASATVVYDSNRTGNYEIYKMDLASGSVSQLTSDRAYDSWWARISPDGTEMIFNRTPAGTHDTDYTKVSLWKARIDGTDARPIIANRRYGWWLQGHAEWSPDGTKLVMYGGTSIWVTDTDGNLRNAVTNGIDPIWSRDGSRIIYVKCANPPGCTPGTYQIASIGPDGSSPRDLTPVLPQLSANDPTMSPDGTTITWEASIDGFRWDLMAANSDGSNVRTLFTDAWMNSNPVWSPDGTRILFYKNKPFYDINVWSIRPDGSDLSLVTRGQPGVNEMADVGLAR